MQTKDLSLLVIFDAIMTEGSITQAAQRLALTQPAVSNAVARMRTRWGDELFLREGNHIKPTSFALNLWQQIRDPLEGLAGAITPGTFDPSIVRRTFRVCAEPDAVIDNAWSRLRQTIEAEAPGIVVHTFPYHTDEAESTLMDGQVDLIVGATQLTNSVVCTEHLFVQQYVCVMRPEHALAGVPLTLQNLTAAEHLFVSSMSCQTRDLVDQALAHYDLERRVAMTVHHHGAVPRLIRETNLIAVVPSTAIEAAIFSGEVAVRSLPFSTYPTPVANLWHKRMELDQGLSWLRKQIKRFICEAADYHDQQLVRSLSPPKVLAG